MSDPAPTGQMLSPVEILPDRQRLRILFKLGIGDRLRNPIFYIRFMHLIVIKRIDSFSMKIGPDPVEIHIDGVVLLHRPQNIQPSQGKKLSPAFL